MDERKDGIGGADDRYGDGYGYQGGGFGGRDGFGGRGFQSGGPSRVLDDLARLMTDVAGVAQGARREAETVMRAQAERFLAGMDLVSREEFEVVREMAARARTENEALRARLDALEAAPKKAASPRPAAKKAANPDA